MPGLRIKVNSLIFLILTPKLVASATILHIHLIGSNVIEFVNNSWPHLGHVLTTDVNDKADIEQGKHSLCG